MGDLVDKRVFKWGPQPPETSEEQATRTREQARERLRELTIIMDSCMMRDSPHYADFYRCRAALDEYNEIVATFGDEISYELEGE